MRFKLIILNLLLVMIITSCSLNDNKESEIIKLENEINSLKQDNAELTNNIEALNNKLVDYEKGYINRNFVELYNMSETFINAYLNKDIDAMKTLVSNDISINNDCLSYDYEGTNVEVNYKGLDAKISYKLNGYSYENDTASIQFFLEEENDKSRGFVNLTLKNIGDFSIGDVTAENWKIVMVTTDI